MVYRIFVEKKPGLRQEAAALLNDARSLLGVRGLENVRVLNRYDAENISPELFDYAVKTVFSEPQVDTACETPDLDGLAPAAVLDAAVQTPTVTLNADGALLTAAIRLPVRLLLRDAEDRVHYLERTVETTAQTQLTAPCDRVVAVPSLTVDNLHASLADGVLTLRLDCTVTGPVYAVETRRVCVRLEEGAPDDAEKSTLTLCFAPQGTALWEIAKKYRTTVQAIRQENDLKEDVLGSDVMLLVPSV